jgi:hypothetical protein
MHLWQAMLAVALIEQFIPPSRLRTGLLLPILWLALPGG